MEIQIELEESYFAPEGMHPGQCSEVREWIYDGKKFVRPIFDLNIPNAEGIQYKAGRTFDESQMKVFKKMLTEWLGAAIRRKKFDVQALVGKSAIVEIIHIHNEDHREPFRWVNRVLPPTANPSLN